MHHILGGLLKMKFLKKFKKGIMGIVFAIILICIVKTNLPKAPQFLNFLMKIEHWGDNLKLDLISMNLTIFVGTFTVFALFISLIDKEVLGTKFIEITRIEKPFYAFDTFDIVVFMGLSIFIQVYYSGVFLVSIVLLSLNILGVLVILGKCIDYSSNEYTIKIIKRYITKNTKVKLDFYDKNLKNKFMNELNSFTKNMPLNDYKELKSDFYQTYTTFIKRTNKYINQCTFFRLLSLLIKIILDVIFRTTNLFKYAYISSNKTNLFTFDDNSISNNIIFYNQLLKSFLITKNQNVDLKNNKLINLFINSYADDYNNLSEINNKLSAEKNNITATFKKLNDKSLFILFCENLNNFIECTDKKYNLIFQFGYADDLYSKYLKNTLFPKYEHIFHKTKWLLFKLSVHQSILHSFFINSINSQSSLKSNQWNKWISELDDTQKKIILKILINATFAYICNESDSPDNYITYSVLAKLLDLFNKETKKSNESINSNISDYYKDIAIHHYKYMQRCKVNIVDRMVEHLNFIKTSDTFELTTTDLLTFDIRILREIKNTNDYEYLYLILNKNIRSFFPKKNSQRLLLYSTLFFKYIYQDWENFNDSEKAKYKRLFTQKIIQNKTIYELIYDDLNIGFYPINIVHMLFNNNSKQIYEADLMLELCSNVLYYCLLFNRSSMYQLIGSYKSEYRTKMATLCKYFDQMFEEENSLFLEYKRNLYIFAEMLNVNINKSIFNRNIKLFYDHYKLYDRF